MRSLQNRWYNFLVDALSLDRSLFQIWLPAAPIDPTDAALWTCENVIPPPSLTFNRAMTKAARLSDQYAAAQSQLESPTASLAQAIGEPHAQAWSAYLATLHPRPAPTELPVLFQNWSARRAIGAMSAGVAWLSRAVLAKAGESPPVAAEVPAFRGGYADLLNLIAASPGASAVFDSRAVSAEVSAWADGADSGVAGLWAESDGEALDRKFAASHVTARMKLGACASWAVIPAEWYNSSVLAAAFSSAASPPWRPGASPSWNDLFALRGSLRRAPASLVVADGIELTVTSDADFDPEQQRMIHDHARAGVWPLYAPATGAVDAVVRFGPSGTMSLRITTRAGHPIILGANVLGIARYLGRTD